MRSLSEQRTHATVCQIEEEVFLIYLSNWRKKQLLKTKKLVTIQKCLKSGLCALSDYHNEMWFIAFSSVGAL